MPIIKKCLELCINIDNINQIAKNKTPRPILCSCMDFKYILSTGYKKCNENTISKLFQNPKLFYNLKNT